MVLVGIETFLYSGSEGMKTMNGDLYNMERPLRWLAYGDIIN